MANSRHFALFNIGKAHWLTIDRIATPFFPSKFNPEYRLFICSHCPTYNISEDYAAARAVPESLLLRWPHARLVTLYKESPQLPPQMTVAVNGGGSCRQTNTGGSLGFNIVGGDCADGIYVSHIHPDRPAARSKAISIGDRLLMASFSFAYWLHSFAFLSGWLQDITKSIMGLLYWDPDKYLLRY